MRATVMYGVHDVRVEAVPDARIVEPTDALVRVTRACICGSDLWPYNSMPASETGHREQDGERSPAGEVLIRRASPAAGRSGRPVRLGAG